MSPLLLFFPCEGGNSAYEPVFVVPAVHTAAQISMLLWVSCQHPAHLCVVYSTQTKLEGLPFSGCAVFLQDCILGRFQPLAVREKTLG